MIMQIGPTVNRQGFFTRPLIFIEIAVYFISYVWFVGFNFPITEKQDISGKQNDYFMNSFLTETRGLKDRDIFCKFTLVEI